MPSFAVTTVTVLCKSSTSVLKMLLQRNGHAQCDLKTLRQTPARHLIGIDIDSGHTSLLLSGSIIVEQPMMHRGVELEQDMSASQTYTAADAHTSKGSCVYQVHVGIAYIDGLVKFNGCRTVNVDLAT